mgnify:CR=1 FL=1
MTQFRIFLFLALRNLFGRKILLLFMLSAVSFGLAFQWPNIANLMGYAEELKLKYIKRSSGDVKLLHKKHKYFNPTQLEQLLSKNNKVQEFFPRIRVHGLLGLPKNEGIIGGAKVVGVGTTEWQKMVQLSRHAVQKYLKKTPPSAEKIELLFGHSLFRTYKLKKGQKLSLYLKVKGEDDIKEIPVKNHIPVQYAIRSSEEVIFPLTFLQKHLKRKQKVTEVAVVLKQTAEEGKLNFTAPDNAYEATPWWEGSDFVRSAIGGIYVLMFLSSMMVLIGVSIPLIALLYISVLQDREDIALLCSMGFRRKQIFAIYCLRGILIATIGCVCGTLFGYGLLRYFQVYPIYDTWDFVIRPAWNMSDLWFSLVVVFSITVLSGIYPAYKAAQINPVQLFRGE